MANKSSSKTNKKKSNPIKVCIACQNQIGEVDLDGSKMMVCPNEECPRFGLLTVVFAQLRKKPELKEVEKIPLKEDAQKS